ncbi:DsbA family protein [Parvularcula marina]|uniref:DsbA family protein n=1 Tax=Parvularcula marina TaxID=2292771 RepID=A0A371RHH3_9PROT|nr:DsbA family protein [Parvularcula marina]RFB04875.1 DsbA family protein [Parvularcula marina]
MTRFLALLSLSTLALAACGGGNDETAEPDASANAVFDSETTVDTDAMAEAAEEKDAPKSVPAPEGSKAGDAMILGAEDAPLTIVEYASSTCPACAAFHSQVFPKIKEEYIDTGKVRFEYREFPTNPQNLAYAGFYLARCAATDRGAPAYFAMLDTLYERQREWAYGPNPGPVLESIASQAGIDREGLQSCLYREDVKAAVKANVMRGLEDDNVRQTPTFMIDGKEVDWGRSEEGMMAMIDSELAKRAQ